MSAVYAYNPKNKRFTMEFDGGIYSFTFDHASASGACFWSEDGKLIARTYKGFRNKLGIPGGTAKANELVTTIAQAKNVNG